MNVSLAATLILGLAMLGAGCSSEADVSAMSSGTQLSERERDAYLKTVVSQLSVGADNVYVYLLPSRKHPNFKETYDLHIRNAKADLSRGSMTRAKVVFGAADSGGAADFAISALKDVEKGRLRGARVVLIGDKSEEGRVARVVSGSGASFEFIEIGQ